MEQNLAATIRDLYPNFTEKELEEAEENLELYVALVLRIFERMELESNPQVNRLTTGTGTLPCTPPKSKLSD